MRIFTPARPPPCWARPIRYGGPAGGQETTIQSLPTAFYHGGCIVASGYVDPARFHVGNPDDVALAAARLAADRS